MKKMVVFAGLLGAPGAVFSLNHHPEAATQHDPRSVRLKSFFVSYGCPLSDYAADFVMAADKNNLDWRLLPGISMQESGGGKNYRNHNVLGWRSGHQEFASIRAGIRAVASSLGGSPLYRDKSLDEILRIYNRNPEFARRVKTWMNALSPVSN